MPDAVAGRLLLDTDVLVEYLRGRKQAIRFLEASEAAFLISAVTVAELHAGVKGKGEAQALLRFLRAFEILAVDEEVARKAGEFRRTYGRSHGLGLADAMIAATADIHDARLTTFNTRHFPMFKRLRKPYRRT